ncbi:MAG: hypothetical protein CVU17_04280 [Betaproteobacteria bacterium HGW-Betaproteobacteria-11]|nr:MAG: hypothetical protein CVU17_04280 [Betaproteobacteria bacterium HGW-Betaproteobacteria-11]
MRGKSSARCGSLPAKGSGVMFSIHGIAGQVFSGTLEAMDRVRRLAHVRSVRTIAQDDEEFGGEAVVTRPTQEAVRALSQDAAGGSWSVARSSMWRR